MTDIVERLRMILGEGIGNDAADEIERLRRWVKGLEGDLVAMTECAKNHDQARTKYQLELAELRKQSQQVAQVQGEPVARSEGWQLNERELELIDGMIETQLNHASRCDTIANRTMAEKQKGWDMERVELLRKVKAASLN